MSIYDEANGAFAEVHEEGLLGEPCNIANVSAVAVFDAERSTYRFDGQSQRHVIIRNAVVLKSNLANRPADRAIVTKDTSNYVIVTVSDDPCQWILSLEKRT